MPLEDLQQASQMLVQALAIREKYMNNSKQSFPSITSRFLRTADKRPHNSDDDVQHDDRMAIAGTDKRCDKGRDVFLRKQIVKGTFTF